jgi:hypothetical protein
MTQDDVDILYGAMCKQKKGSKAYWEAKSNYVAAMANMYNYKYISLRDELDGTPLATVVEERDAALRTIKDLKDQQDETHKRHQLELSFKDADMEAIRSELTALCDALGMSELDWDHAKAHGKLPNGQLLILD